MGDHSLASRGAMTLAEKLKVTERHYRWAAETADKAREKRNEAVREALNAGWSHARIAEATGLSRGRISQFKG